VGRAYVVCGTGFASVVIFGVQARYRALLHFDVVDSWPSKRLNGRRSLAKPVPHLRLSVEKSLTRGFSGE
jgi:hypothetical protein